MSDPALILARGIPGSGKSTWAKAWVAEDPENRIRLNRDDLRAMLGVKPGEFNPGTEQIVTTLQHQGARAALKAGKSVVVDDTNLRARFIRQWFKIGPVEFRDFEIDLDLAIARDRSRENAVGEAVIRKFHQRYLASNGGKLPAAPVQESGSVTPDLVVEPYVPPLSRPDAIIVDTDGTVAIHDGRSPYDYSLVHTDLPNENVIELVRALYNRGVVVIGVSGRPDSVRAKTEAWWEIHRVPFDLFFMRPASQPDTKDDKVKLDIFNEHIRNQFNVVGVFDDRDRVVAMWRALGLTTYQVNYGNF